MCGIGGILRILKPGDADYPTGDAALRAPSGAWLWHGMDVRDLAYAQVDSGATAWPAGQAVPSRASIPKTQTPPPWIIPESWLDAIDENIAWRGPDGAGRFRDRVIKPDGTIVEVALVHRRLSIIDIEGGAQPMVVTRCPRCAEKALGTGHQPLVPNAKCQVPSLSAIVFNGCIYNHRELRAELEAKGHVFESDHSDTEVILHAYSEHPQHFEGSHPNDPDIPALGSILSEILDGMYAFAIWDSLRSTIVLARDGAGEKPLYGLRRNGFLSFASGVNGLMHDVPIPQDNVQNPSCWPEPIAMRDSLADWIAFGHSEQHVPHERICSLWRTPLPFEVGDKSAGYQASLFGWLIAACGLLLAIGIPLFLHYFLIMIIGFAISTGLVWYLLKLPLPFVIRGGVNLVRGHKQKPRLLDTLDDVLSEAVLSRLDADVPIGCFLSGGIDSSLIALYAKHHLAHLTTLTVRMPSDAYDESPYAERVAAHLGTDHLTLECNAQTAAIDLVHIVETLGLPFGDSSILPSYWLCREASCHTKVALSGDGGDELYYGYDRYKAMQYLGIGRWAFKCVPIGGIDRSDPKSRDERLARLVTAARNLGYSDLLAIFPTPDRRALLGFAAGNRCKRGIFGGPAAARYDDLDSYLPGDLLRKTDTSSMMCGVEVRSPFLARSAANAALRSEFRSESGSFSVSRSVSARVHMKGGETKHLLKELARKHLPREIVDRPKQGFAIPISDWWRNDFGGLQTLLLDMLAGDRPFGRVHDVLEINMGFVRQMLDEHWAAGGLTPLHTTRHVRPRDHGQRLFALVSLAIWSRSIHRRDAESAEKRI